MRKAKKSTKDLRKAMKLEAQRPLKAPVSVIVPAMRGDFANRKSLAGAK
jgi:hypothetical protein